ncbi:MAG: pseudouridine synthase [Thermotogota bacterium]|nr:pseudouridine synthase [Thermotogota bacterium]
MTSLSRRKAGKAIKSGVVKVDGKVVTEPWVQIEPQKNTVGINNEIIENKFEKKVVYAFYKPAGTITTMNDEKGRRCVGDIVRNRIKESVFHVGRLDKETEGLLLLTNDGELANKLTHPSSEIKKTYLVMVDSNISESELNNIMTGVKLRDGHVTAPAKVEVLSDTDKGTLVKLVIHEGHKREAREMFRTLGKKVIKLRRIGIGRLPIKLVSEPGNIKLLSPSEIELLFMEPS